MRFVSIFVGFLKAGLEADMRQIEPAVAVGVKDAGEGLKGVLRRQVVTAGPWGTAGQHLAEPDVYQPRPRHRRLGLEQGAADRPPRPLRHVPDGGGGDSA
ncbi:MAG: hypothetical protein IPM60_15475 [Rhodospirillales bacterium]|nr:hypothetical protein [Rhodospirillales bacterium]